MTPHTYSAGDYAGIETDKFKVYYGFEHTDPTTGDWLFIVWKNDKEVFRRTNTELLDVAPGGSPLDMLVAGMALYLAR